MVIKLEDEDYMRFLNDQSEKDDEVMDPLYKTFLEHLREDGKSYIFELINGDRDLPAIVKYERDEVSEESEVDTQRSLGNTACHKRGHFVTKRRLKGTRSQSKSDELVGLSFVPESRSESPLLDEAYQTFLSHLKFKDNLMILQYNSTSVTYEEEKDTSTASESLGTDSTAYTDGQGLVPYKSTQPFDLILYEDDNSAVVSLDCSELSDFKTKLMVALDKPYDQNEFEELYKEATDRKPLNRQKHLRSMSISYPTAKVGFSYLDHFPDLGRQIESADSHMGLTLLRGFFFWLKNLCHDGAFMPWISSSSDAIIAADYELVVPLEIARDDD